MDSNFAGWKIKTLSLAGRVTLAQSVLAAAYVMQTSFLPIETYKEIDKRVRNFVWGSSEEGRKIRLLNWDKICSPKEDGGLGLRQARYLNLSYMTKLAFISFRELELLWVCVLQGKYFKESMEGLVPAHRSSQSNIWRGICFAWPNMMEGARAGVRDGKTTSLWETKWLDSGIMLGEWAVDSEPDFNPMDRVADFANGDEGWVLDELNKLLPNEIVEQVVGRSPPREEFGSDVWLWGDNHDGRFSIKSAYNQILRKSPQEAGVSWDKIWKWMDLSESNRSFGSPSMVAS
ncbi:Putative ribonuclease H protein At1g65750 [Linum perenne]